MDVEAEVGRRIAESKGGDCRNLTGLVLWMRGLGAIEHAPISLVSRGDSALHFVAPSTLNGGPPGRAHIHESTLSIRDSAHQGTYYPV